MHDRPGHVSREFMRLYFLRTNAYEKIEKKQDSTIEPFKT